MADVEYHLSNRLMSAETTSEKTNFDEAQRVVVALAIKNGFSRPRPEDENDSSKTFARGSIQILEDRNAHFMSVALWEDYNDKQTYSVLVQDLRAALEPLGFRIEFGLPKPQ